MWSHEVLNVSGWGLLQTFACSMLGLQVLLVSSNQVKRFEMELCGIGDDCFHNSLVMGVFFVGSAQKGHLATSN